MQDVERKESLKSKVVAHPMTPQQVSLYSGAVIEGLRMGLPTMNGDEGAIARVFADVVTGKIKCWALLRNKTVLGIMTTLVSTEEYTGKNSLVIFSIQAHESVSRGEWAQLYEFFENHAREIGCSRMHGFSCVPEAIDLADSLGWDTSQRVLMKEFDQ